MKKYIILSIVWLSSIYATGQDATVMLVRKDLYTGVKKNISLFVDDKFICEISDDKFIAYKITPGKHKFYGQWYGTTPKEKAADNESIEIDVKSGQEYYLKAVKDARGVKSVLILEELTASSWAKLKNGIKEVACK